MHTHVAENVAEVRWVADLFPESRSYLDVYDRYGLLRERSVFAHCIHLDRTDRERMAEAGAAMAFCPSPNLFLGSGLFDLAAARELGVRIGVGTDVGGGTNFSQLRTLNEAYKATQLNGQKLAPFQALYLATLGAARALYLDDQIGNFIPGKEADFVVLDWRSTSLLARRTDVARDLVEKLFALIMLGDRPGSFCNPHHGERRPSAGSGCKLNPKDPLVEWKAPFGPHPNGAFFQPMARGFRALRSSHSAGGVASPPVSPRSPPRSA